MIFRDHFGYRRHAREIHRERIALEKAAHKGFSSIELSDAIELIAIARRLAMAMFPVAPPSFRQGGIVATKRHEGDFIIPNWMQRSGAGAGQVPAHPRATPATRPAP